MGNTPLRLLLPAAQVLRPIVPPPGAKPASPAKDKEKGEKADKGGSGSGGGNAAPSGKEGGSSGGLPASQGGSPPAAGRVAAAEPEAEQPPPAKVGIPLEGCTVELVADGLKGRSEFIRRAPLLISHPRWPLLEGERAFYLWAGAEEGGEWRTLPCRVGRDVGSGEGSALLCCR